MQSGAFVMMDALGFKALSAKDPEKLRDKMHEIAQDNLWLGKASEALKEAGLTAPAQMSLLSDTVVIGMPLIRDSKYEGPPQLAENYYAAYTLSFAVLAAAEFVMRAGLRPCP